MHIRVDHRKVRAECKIRGVLGFRSCWEPSCNEMFSPTMRPKRWRGSSGETGDKGSSSDDAGAAPGVRCDCDEPVRPVRGGGVLRPARRDVRGGHARQLARLAAMVPLLDAAVPPHSRRGVCVPRLWRRRRLVGAAHVHPLRHLRVCRVRHRPPGPRQVPRPQGPHS